MSVVATFSRLLLARQALQYLASRGVRAEIIGEHDAYGGALGYRLWVPGLSDTAAKALLAELSALPPPDPGWEAQSLPDLSLLDPALAPACPNCSRTLPLDTGLRSCPACGGPVDPAALILAAHGPEALIAAYPTDDPGAELKDPFGRVVGCPACRYDLVGLANTGSCPECGEHYSKRTIIDNLPA